MNFKIIFYIFLICTFFGCGVKSKPLAYPDKAIPSYIDSYTVEDKDYILQQQGKK